MKHWYRRLPVKILCFILCLVFLCVAVADTVAAVIMVEENVYTVSKESFLDNETRDRIRYAANSIAYVTASGKSTVILNDYKTDTSNIRYKVVSDKNEILASNIEASKLTSYDNKWKYEYEYQIIYNGTSYDAEPVDTPNGSTSENVWTVYICLEEGLPVNDRYAVTAMLVDVAYTIRYAVYPILIVSLLLSVVCFVLLMCASGRRANSDEVHGGTFNRIPFDALLVLSVCACILMFQILDSARRLEDGFVVAFGLLLCFLSACIFIGLCMSFAARLKQGTLLTNTVIWRCCLLLRKILKYVWALLKRFGKRFKELVLGIPMIWRTLTGLLVFLLLSFLAYVVTCDNEEGFGALLWFISHSALTFLLLFAALYMRKLQKGGEALAKGDLAYQIDTEKMFWDFKKHGENLNRIADGMTVAVEERLQSERMKAELITNVSHDIKTPLTSIINYANLISDEECSSEKHKEYAEVLVRKSEHLKRLLEDLVEISKASTGNLDVALLPCDASVLLSQAAGEFEQRCEEADLKLVTAYPEKTIRIMADSRRIWRVFENLMINACKYSLPNSRVYLSLAQIGDEAHFVFRNTSKEPLNISPDELMERFVRGDESRSTEGNGLGLSIARSLTELQNGKMEIMIDGDLFKVTLKFNCI